jgi:hypothetical protein
MGTLLHGVIRPAVALQQLTCARHALLGLSCSPRCSTCRQRSKDSGVRWPLLRFSICVTAASERLLYMASW